MEYISLQNSQVFLQTCVLDSPIVLMIIVADLSHLEGTITFSLIEAARFALNEFNKTKVSE